MLFIGICTVETSPLFYPVQIRHLKLFIASPPTNPFERIAISLDAETLVEIAKKKNRQKQSKQNIYTIRNGYCGMKLE